jgi:hypothetical protein
MRITRFLLFVFFFSLPALTVSAGGDSAPKRQRVARPACPTVICPEQPEVPDGGVPVCPDPAEPGIHPEDLPSDTVETAVVVAPVPPVPDHVTETATEPVPPLPPPLGLPPAPAPLWDKPPSAGCRAKRLGTPFIEFARSGKSMCKICECLIAGTEMRYLYWHTMNRPAGYIHVECIVGVPVNTDSLLADLTHLHSRLPEGPLKAAVSASWSALQTR